MKDKNVKIAKKIITEEVEKAGYKLDKIILFGSRARGDYDEYSDYDFFIILKEEFTRNTMLNLISNIGLRLSRYITTDIFLKSKKKLLKEKNDIGLLSYYVLKDGVKI